MLLLSSQARAQSSTTTSTPPAGATTVSDVDGGPETTARIHAGPLGITPTFSLHDVGVNSNVFNTPDNPQQDFTAAFGPGAMAWLRAGVVHLSTNTTTGWNYFQKNTKQRSFDFSETDRVDVSLVHVVPHVGGTYNRTRQRPNLEIDERVQQKNTSIDAGVSLLIGSRTTVDVDYLRARTALDQGDFGDVLLAGALNRRSASTVVSARVVLTPLTTFLTSVSTTRDRFDLSPLRNSNSVRVEPGLEFKPLALVSGTAKLGIRRFEALAPGVPNYSGLVGAVSLMFTASDVTRVTTTFNRDIDYSFDDLTPYFISTTAGAELTQSIGGNFDLQGRFGFGTLAYRGDELVLAALAAARIDHYRSVGGGIGRHVSDNVRIGINVDYGTRTSSFADRSYSGYRIGGSLTYGY
jgi:hypothetical protein